MNKTHLTEQQVIGRLEFILDSLDIETPTRIFGVPRGGTIAAALLCSKHTKLHRCVQTFNIDEADVIVDDIVDSGRTKKQWADRYPDIPFISVVDKTYPEIPPDMGWVVFPWESHLEQDDAPNLIVRMLEHIGEDPQREGLLETPERVVRSWKELYAGYGQDPASVMKVFEDGACDEMVLLKNVEFFSTCLAGSTFIDTPKGRIPINRLKHGEFVYCWDEEGCRMTIGRAIHPRITGMNQRLWRVYTDKDTLLCTGNHKLLTHTRGWIEARNLRSGDSIVALNKGVMMTGSHTRAHIVWTGECRQVPEHRFIYEEINGPLGDRHIHHLDGQCNNNDPENLTALRASAHARLHRAQDPLTGFALFSDDQRKAMKKAQIKGIRKSQTEEVRRRRSASVKKYWDSLTPQQKAERNHRVLLVEKTNWREDVWCMDVPKHHNFIANGMVVHNCEHHLLPFFGKAHIAYIPNGKVIGVSKLARLLDIFSRRAQIQERIGKQVTDALMTHLQPLGAACIIQAQHFCMKSRGVQKQESVMVTSSLEGVFRENSASRAELLELIK